MLHFILGRSGSGKTHFVREQLSSMARDPNTQNQLLLMVPEQYSFESERAMLQQLGPKDAQRVEILSFQRLCEVIFQQYGQASQKQLDDGGRGILMSLALEQVGGELEVYGEYARSAELVSMMLSVSAEWKMCGITPKGCLELGARVTDAALRAKIRDISLILSCYDALVQQSFLDPQDNLTRVKRVILEHRVFHDTVIFLDSFKGFTQQELDVLELMLIQGNEVFVSLCMDTLEDSEHGMGLFSHLHKTANQIKQLARDNHIRIAAPVHLEPGKRFMGKGLAHLEEQVFRAEKTRFPEPTEEIVLFAAGNPYEEAVFVASTIRRLVMQEGYRYRDFAVIARSLEEYRNDLDMAMEQYQIPCFMDHPKKIDADPLMRLVLSAFHVVKSNFSSDEIFTYLKTGLVDGMPAYEISLLENYTYLWNLSGRKWLTEWTNHPRGYAEEMTEEDTALLAQLNGLRQQTVAPLEQFAQAIDGQDGKGISRAIYELLLEIRADECLVSLCEKLKACGQIALAEEQLRLWELLMSMLDQTAAVLHSIILSPQRFVELLRLVMVAGDISTIPQGLDEISIGEAGRMRPDRPKVVFVIGAAQGEFPAVPANHGAFCDRERQTLIALGLPLSSTAEQTILEERFLAYTALTVPSEHLFVSWHTNTLNGKERLPSSLIREIQALFPKVSLRSARTLPKEYFANSLDGAFELAAREYQRNSPLSSTLQELFSQRPEYAHKLSALERACQKLPAFFAHEEKSRELFGSWFRFSATQIEKYHLCRFQYFCHYGLGAKERHTATLDMLEYGSLMHHLLERMFGEYGHEQIIDMDQEILQGHIFSCMQQYVDQKMGGLEQQSPRLRNLLNRMTSSAQVVIVHIAEELGQSRFVPCGYEMSLRHGGDFPPFQIPLPGGGQVTIEGLIDRVDTFEQDGESYVRIIDYKTGKKEFRLSDVLYGLNMQMLIYLAALIEHTRLQPAGILYMPAIRPYVSASDRDDPKRLRKKVSDELRMNGLLIGETPLLDAMDPEGKGRYIPPTRGKDGTYKGNSLISSEQMRKILQYVKSLVVNMAQDLKEGKISADPLKGSYDACTYCPYFCVCGHEASDGGRMEIQYEKTKEVEQVFRKIEQKGEKE